MSFSAGQKKRQFFKFSARSLTMLPLLEHLVYIIQWQEPSWKSDQQEHCKGVGKRRAGAGLHRNLPSMSPRKAQSQPQPNSAERNRLKFRSDIKAAYSKYFQSSEGLVSPLSVWKGEFCLSEDSETCLLLPGALRNINVFVNVFPFVLY